MKTHTTIGAGILRGSQSQLVRLGEQIALTHHEHWDGNGYPRGLRGEEIPLAGRICEISRRLLRRTSRPGRTRIPSPFEDVIGEMGRLRGTQFDDPSCSMPSWASPGELHPGLVQRRRP